MKKQLSDNEYKQQIIQEGIHFFLNTINSVEEANQLFKHDRQLVLEKYLEEKKLYSDIFIEYITFIDLLVKLLNNLKISNDLEYSIAIGFLIAHGYLSKDLKFNRGESKNELRSDYGINIIMGEGCCRNFSDFHYNVMKEANKFVEPYFCASKVPFKSLKKTKANHILNLIKQDNIFYGIDLYNAARLFKFKNGYTLKDISFISSAILRNKPYLNLIYTDETIDDIVQNIKLYEEDSKKRHLSPFEYYDNLLPTIIEYLKDQKDLFMDFHNETKNIKDNICEGMQRKLILSEKGADNNE